MIMAAGLGTRLRPFTEHTPKALLPLMGIPLAQYCVDGLAAAGVSKVVANVHHLADRAVQGLHGLDWNGMHLEISDESTQILGSAGGLAHARDLLGTRAPFFIANADVLADLDWSELANRHLALRRQWGVQLTLAVFERPTVAGRYTEILWDPDKELITGLGPSVEGRPLYVGAAVVEPEILAGLNPNAPAEFVPTLLNPAIRQRRAGVYFTKGLWLDIGSPELWAQSHFIVMDQLESGNLRGPASRIWRQRLERSNLRCANGIWTSRRGHLSAQAHWIPPIYLDATRAQGEFGPHAIGYGKDIEGFKNGIRFNGLKWS